MQPSWHTWPQALGAFGCLTISPTPITTSLRAHDMHLPSSTAHPAPAPKAKAMLQPATYDKQGTKPLARATRAQEAAAQLRADGYKQASAGLAAVNVSFEDHVRHPLTPLAHALSSPRSLYL